MKKSIKITGTPKIETRKIAKAFHPWTQRPIDGSEPHDCCGYPIWPERTRNYAKTAFATKKDAIAWIKAELNKYVKMINTKGGFGFYEPLIKGTGKLVKVGNGFKVSANWENYSGETYVETYAKGGIKEVEVEL